MSQRSSSLILLIFTPFVLALILVFICFRAYWIPSGSMKPSLLVGDYVFANRVAYGFPALFCSLGLCSDDMGPIGRDVARGDVVTFRHPISGQHWVKRIIGVPGDRVQMRSGVMYLNGTMVEQVSNGTFIETFKTDSGMMICTNAPVAVGEACNKTQLSERLPDGPSYSVLDLANDRFLDDTSEFKVPAGNLFVMGDNRDNSMDSRALPEQGGIGFVPLDHIIARVDLIVFSLTGQEGRFLRWVE